MPAQGAPAESREGRAKKKISSGLWTLDSGLPFSVGPWTLDVGRRFSRPPREPPLRPSRSLLFNQKALTQRAAKNARSGRSRREPRRKSEEKDFLWTLDARLWTAFFRWTLDVGRGTSLFPLDVGRRFPSWTFFYPVSRKILFNIPPHLWLNCSFSLGLMPATRWMMSRLAAALTFGWRVGLMVASMRSCSMRVGRMA